MVERLIRNQQVAGSSPVRGSGSFQKSGSSSGVEHQLPKLRVAGSNPVSRSFFGISIAINTPQTF